MKIEKSLKEVAWTGLVTAFYCEYCHQEGLCTCRDPIRGRLVRKLRGQLRRERINPYQVLDRGRIPKGQMVNVAVRKKELDRLLRQVLQEQEVGTVANIGCGFDTQAYRLEGYGGQYIDIDLPEVAYWKKKYVPERPGYHIYGTRKVFGKGFFAQLKKKCSGKAVFVVEGLFCYIPYRQVLSFVHNLYQNFPDAVLLCDTFLFQENYRFNDPGSQFKLEHPQWGYLYDRFPRLCKGWMRLGRKGRDSQEEKQADAPVAQEEKESCLRDIILTDVSVSGGQEASSYWIGRYERLAEEPEGKLGQLRRQRQAYAKSGQFGQAKALNREILELEVAGKKTEVSFYPVNLQVEHTDKCNARCVMCSHFFTKNHGAADAGEGLMEALRPVLPYVGRITLQGMGEPFLHPDILTIIKTYHRFGIQMTCSTNASVMTRELAEAIHQSFYDINISCDACTAATYESIRKGLCFSKFLEHVRLLRGAGEGLRMQMAVVAMRQNIEELPGIVGLAAQLGFQAVTVMDVTVQMLLENDRDSLRHYPTAAAHFLQEAQEAAKHHGLAYAFPEYLLHLPKERTLEEELGLIRSLGDKPEGFAESLYRRYESSGFLTPRIEATTDQFAIPSQYRCSGICRMAVERPFVEVNGNMFLCCANWMHSLGNICRDGGFLKVWNGPVMQEIRRMFYEGWLPKYCVGCIFLRDEMLSGIKILNPDKDFYRHNYDGQMQALLKEVEKP
ncbi:MAG: radical SAM protein [Lachnospiraceae bacterium]|nr:radical SAM protein [Lachnospiraceae bacterium]